MGKCSKTFSKPQLYKAPSLGTILYMKHQHKMYTLLHNGWLTQSQSTSQGSDEVVHKENQQNEFETRNTDILYGTLTNLVLDKVFNQPLTNSVFEIG